MSTTTLTLRDTARREIVHQRQVATGSGDEITVTFDSTALDRAVVLAAFEAFVAAILAG